MSNTNLHTVAPGAYTWTDCTGKKHPCTIHADGTADCLGTRWTALWVERVERGGQLAVAVFPQAGPSENAGPMIVERA